MHSRQECWISFKCERLPYICYWCGKLTHSDKECPTWLKSKGSLKDGDKQFGTWLRASAPNPSRKTVIRIVAFDENHSRDVVRNNDEFDGRNNG